MTMAMSPEEAIEVLLDRGRTLPHDEEGDEQEVKMDKELVQEGITYFHSNFFSMFVAMLTGLVCLLYTESIAVVLHFTGRSSSPTTAFLRYLSTLEHTVSWYEGVPSIERSLKYVRAQHKNAARVAKGRGRMMSQYDMVLTQWGFIGPALLFPHHLGISSTKGMEGLVYMMYLVGRQLGVREELNLCAGGRERAVQYSRLMLDRVVRPSLVGNPSKMCRDMTNYLLDGMNILNPFIDQVAFHFRVRHILLSPGEAAKEDMSKMEVASYLLFHTMNFVFSTLLHLPILGGGVRFLANNLMKLNIVLAGDWKEFIVSGLNNEEKTTGWNFRLPRNRALAFLVIPALSGWSGLMRLDRWMGKQARLLGGILILGLVFSNMIEICKWFMN